MIKSPYPRLLYKLEFWLSFKQMILRKKQTLFEVITILKALYDYSWRWWRYYHKSSTGSEVLARNTSVAKNMNSKHAVVSGGWYENDKGLCCMSLFTLSALAFYKIPLLLLMRSVWAQNKRLFTAVDLKLPSWILSSFASSFDVFRPP